MLAYQEYLVATATTLPAYKFPPAAPEALNACSLIEDETLRCYQWMTRDIATLSAGIAHRFYLTGTCDSLWRALTAPARVRTARWRRFYQRACCLATRSAAHVQPGTLGDEFVQALERLEHFVRENADLA